MTSDRIIKTAIAMVALSILAGCGGSQRPRPIASTGTTNAPPLIELRREVHASMLYFPAGTYTLSSADKIGYYYTAPRKIMQHTAAGRIPREGGLFVSKRNRAKLRGYIYLGGGAVHVGNFSRADYSFRVGTSEEYAPAEGPAPY